MTSAPTDTLTTLQIPQATRDRLKAWADGEGLKLYAATDKAISAFLDGVERGDSHPSHRQNSSNATAQPSRVDTPAGSAATDPANATTPPKGDGVDSVCPECGSHSASEGQG